MAEKQKGRMVLQTLRLGSIYKKKVSGTKEGMGRNFRKNKPQPGYGLELVVRLTACLLIQAPLQTNLQPDRNQLSER